MRLVVLVTLFWVGLVAGCGGGQRKPADPDRLAVTDVAVWFAKASLMGDRATARSMMLEHYQLAGFTQNPPSPEEWSAELDAYLDGRAREGDDLENPLLRAEVVETKRLRATDESKLKEDVRVAILRLEVHRDGDWHAAPMPLIFVETSAGWKFTPKK